MQLVGPKMTLDFSNIIHRLSISTCSTSSPSRYRLHCTSFSTYLMQVYTGASREPHNALQCALWRGAGPPCGIYILRCWAHWFGFDYLCEYISYFDVCAAFWPLTPRPRTARKYHVPRHGWMMDNSHKKCEMKIMNIMVHRRCFL